MRSRFLTVLALLMALFVIVPTKVMATVNQTVKITFPFGDGTEGQRATFDSDASAALFKLDYVSYGGSLTLYGKNTAGGVVQTLFQPISQESGASLQNAVNFTIAPKYGLKFTPTKVSFKTTRYGTDGGKLNVVWVNSDDTEVMLAQDMQPNRDNGDPAYSTCEYDVTGATASANGCALRINIYSLGEQKQVGLGDIVIEGTVTGTATEAPQYKPNIIMSPYGAGSISILPEGTTFEPGDVITLVQKRNTGFKFKNWSDANDNKLGKDDSYTYRIGNESAIIKANYVTRNTYSVDINIAGGANDYMVESVPEGTIKDGKYIYEEGDIVKLTANSNNILTFTNWSNGETTNTISLGMTQDYSITANYSSVDYIAAWDFHRAGNLNRNPDFASENNKTSALVLRDSEGNVVSWTDGSKEMGGHVNQTAAVNGHDDKPIGTYYFQTMINTTGYSNVSVASKMVYTCNTYKKYNLEYSLDGTEWKNAGVITLGRVRTWKSTTFTLPEEASNQKQVYLRWKADVTSTISGSSSEVDGIALGVITILGDSQYTNDGKAPKMVSSLPIDNEQEAPVSGKVVLTFDKDITLSKTNNATIGNTQLSATIVGNTVLYAYTDLEYDTDYTFTLPANTVSDRGGNVLNEDMVIKFKTQSAPKTMKQRFDFIVPDDGTFAEAIKEAGKRTDTSRRFYIFVRQGDYLLPGDEELTTTGSDGETYHQPTTRVNTPNISIIGEGMKITNLRNEADPVIEGLGKCQTINFGSKVKNAYLQDITLSNGIPYLGGRGAALQDEGDMNIFKNVCLFGGQDTYLSNNQSGHFYFEGGSLQGYTDYLCGKGDVLYNGVELMYRRNGSILTAPSLAAKYGYVFLNCTIRPEKAEYVDYTLGRPWGSGTPSAIFINTTMEVAPTAEGWSEMSGGYPARFAEYNSRMADGAVVDLSGRKKTFADSYSNNPVLTESEAAQYTISNMFGSWDPTIYTVQASAPENVRIEGDKLLWDDNDYVLCWAVCKDGKVVEFTTEPEYLIDDAATTYSVKAANEMGGLGEEAVAKKDTGVESAVVADKASDVDAPMYNIAGQMVTESYKGIVIKNGKKYLNK